jgi:predicted CXXCH cytochrome family protein
LKIKFTYSFLILSLIILYSCSSSSNNNVINFLFDGASSADTLKSLDERDLKSDSLSNSNQNSNKSITPILVLHEPYKEKMCESCHDIKASFKKILNLSKKYLIVGYHKNFVT